MNPDFSFVNLRGVTLLVFTPWWKQGLIHGMTTGELEFKGANLTQSVGSLCQAIGAAELALAQQSHGAALLDLRSAQARAAMKARYGDLLRRSEADAIAAPLYTEQSEMPTAYGVMSADCVPIIVKGTAGYLLVHAGWRGLANGVIGAALRYLAGAQEAVVFACAGSALYEVGPEVIEAIGDSAVYCEVHGGGGRYLLDTAATAVTQLRRSCPSIEAHSAQLCTINDQRFHSFRRDGEAAGRGVTFVLPPTRAAHDQREE